MNGRPLKIGDESFIVPPPSIAVAKKVMLGLKEISEATDAVAVYDSFVGLLLAALEKNYPDLTAGALEEVIPARFESLIGPLNEALGFGGKSDSGEAPSP
jgi:hypothetical protein